LRLPAPVSDQSYGSIHIDFSDIPVTALPQAGTEDEAYFHQ
jgi:hypothetical protein